MREKVEFVIIVLAVLIFYTILIEPVIWDFDEGKVSATEILETASLEEETIIYVYEDSLPEKLGMWHILKQYGFAAILATDNEMKADYEVTPFDWPKLIGFVRPANYQRDAQKTNRDMRDRGTFLDRWE